ncbi:type II secretion system F family protein [Micromonospora sp. PLK6-60]|uniref:type II secretion system F family protein n=1 Tax=Micromonospora sp. PLK6-60 TaxID=2873383 RepID=UPI001CA674E7|nr:type II secretion system F family protein [Micromonospora sp. PLK6-60]MBY8873685.1 type II secretion system F family protein [Micromonospora sp. PLK6-60]
MTRPVAVLATGPTLVAVLATGLTLVAALTTPAAAAEPVTAAGPIRIAAAPGPPARVPAAGRTALVALAGLTARVVEVTPERVRIAAEVPGPATGQLPPVTVTRDGWRLPATVAAADGGGRTVVLVVDSGPAMAGARLTAVRAGLAALADTLPADVSVGLVAAAGRPAVALPPTRDRAALRAAVSRLAASGERTALYEGLRAGAALGDRAADRRLVVVAGGRDDDGTAAGVAAETVTAAGQRVDLVRLGAAGDGLGQLRRLVGTSGGTVRAVAREAALPDALRAATELPARVTVTVAVPAELAGTATTLTVTAGAGARRVSTDLPVQFAAAPTGVAATDAGPSGLGRLPALHPGLLGLLIFGVLLVALLLVVFGAGGGVPQRRLQQVERFRLPTGGARPDDRAVPAEGGLAEAVYGLSDRMIGTGDRQARIARDLERAGITRSPREWIAWRTGAAAAGAFLLGLLGGVLGVLLGVLLGYAGTALYRRLRTARRRRTFADQLPDALQLVVGSLKSGFSLAQSVDGVIQDFPAGPLTVEFGRAMAEVRLGSDLDDALERAAHRIGNDDLAWVVMAVRIQRDTGGNLAEVLSTTVETLRERDRLRRHVRALSAEGRLSAYILVALPFVIGGWMLLARREYLSPLWTTPVGLVLLVGAAVLMAVGTLWLSRLVKVEV